MSSYQPAILVKMVENEPTSDEIKGEALILISRDEHGGMVASGTFKSTSERLCSLASDALFLYEGLAFEEGNKRHEIRAVMFVQGNQDDLYELEAYTKPVIVHK